MKRNVFLLTVCQALMMTCQSLIGTTSALVGFALADEKVFATLPLALQFLGTMSVTYPASLLMGRIGRRNGFLIGVTIAIVGAAIATWAVMTGNFAAFCLGSFIIGSFNAFGQYYRFAAADVATPDFRSRAISLVLSGGVVAAFAGPNLAALTQNLIADALFAGSYASLVGLYLLSFGVLMFIRIPRATPEPDAKPSRLLATIALQPAYVTAVLSAVIAYGVMNLVMTATPLAMQSKGFVFADTVVVIQWHILGMFGPAFVTGHLIRYLGVIPIMVTGASMLGACAVINLAGDDMVHMWTALVLLGVGWNFLFTGATTLLTETYQSNEKSRAQGLNDFLTFTVVSVTALSSGALHHTFGWQVINQAILVPILLCLLALTWLWVKQLRVSRR